MTARQEGPGMGEVERALAWADGGDVEHDFIERDYGITLAAAYHAQAERIKELEARFAKFKTIGCSCDKDDTEPGDCYGCRGQMISLLEEEKDQAEAALANLKELYSDYDDVSKANGDMAEALEKAEAARDILLTEREGMHRLAEVKTKAGEELVAENAALAKEVDQLNSYRRVVVDMAPSLTKAQAGRDSLALQAEQLRGALKKPCGCQNGLHDSMLLGPDLRCHQVKALAALSSPPLERVEAVEWHRGWCSTEDDKNGCDCDLGKARRASLTGSEGREKP